MVVRAIAADQEGRAGLVLVSGYVPDGVGWDCVVGWVSGRRVALRLTVTTGIDLALDLLEAHTLHRTRLTYRHGVDDFAARRAADPDEEPLPPFLLIADPACRHERTRIAALLAQGQRLDIHGVLLGAWPDGDTITVAADGTTTADGDATLHGRHPADIGRLTVLDPGETAGLIITLVEAHTGQSQPSAAAEAKPARASLPAVGEPARPVPVERAGEDRQPPATLPAPVVPAATADYATHPARWQDPSDAEHDDAVPAASTARVGRVEVSVFGPPGVVGADPRRPLRAKSLELLAVHAAPPLRRAGTDRPRRM